MDTTDLDYLDLLEDLEKHHADLPMFRALHASFWSERAKRAPSVLPSASVRAYFLGTIPSRLPQSWFLDPEVYLQRIGLYADEFIFDDIVGNVLAKCSQIPRCEHPEAHRQAIAAIRAMSAVRPAVQAGIVRVLPPDNFLDQPGAALRLTGLTLEQGARGDLPDQLVAMLTAEQRQALGDSAGQSILHQLNRALFLQGLRGFIPSADDTCFEMLRRKVRIDQNQLGEIRDLYVLRHVRPEYLCRSTDFVIGLRKDDRVRDVREYLQKELQALFGQDPQVPITQARVDDFGRGLVDAFRKTQSELAELKRRFSHELVDKAARTGTAAAGVGISMELNFGSNAPALLATMAASIYSGGGVMDSIRRYLNERRELRSRPCFLMGSALQ